MVDLLSSPNPKWKKGNQEMTGCRANLDYSFFLFVGGKVLIDVGGSECACPCPTLFTQHETTTVFLLFLPFPFPDSVYLSFVSFPGIISKDP